MKPSIYINPEGVVCYLENCPEEPQFRGDDFLLWGKSYKEALAAAKASAVRFENQDLAKSFHKGEYYSCCQYEHTFHSTCLMRDTIHPFPSEKYSVEIKTLFRDDTGVWLDYDSWNKKVGIEIAIHESRLKQVAVLSPVQKEESQEELRRLIYNLSGLPYQDFLDEMTKFSIKRKEGLL